MGHTLSSTIFMIVVITLLLSKTNLKSKINFIKLHKIMGSILVIYMIIYSVVDYIIDKDSFILLIIPSLIGIYYTGIIKSRIKYKYLHSVCAVIFLITLLIHVLF